MRIISKNHDYYDCIQRTGQDRSVLYIRKEAFVDLDYKVFDTTSPERAEVGLSAYLYVIGFCGRVIPCINLTYYGKSAWCYNTEEIQKFAESVMGKKDLARFYGETNRRTIKYCKFNIIVGMFDIYEKSKYTSRKLIDYKGLFEQYNCPIYVVDHYTHTINVNCSLKEYEFYRIVDSYTAFQTIFQWQSNIAQPDKKIPVISDDMKAATHGFNRYSFRKDASR